MGSSDASVEHLCVMHTDLTQIQLTYYLVCFLHVAVFSVWSPSKLGTDEVVATSCCSRLIARRVRRESSCVCGASQHGRHGTDATGRCCGCRRLSVGANLPRREYAIKACGGRILILEIMSKFHEWYVEHCCVLTRALVELS